MYVTLDQPRFVVTGRVVDGTQCFLTWEFRFRFRRFDTHRYRPCGRLAPAAGRRWSHRFHRDYWDAAEELYEKLPLLGSLMRWLKKRANN